MPKEYEVKQGDTLSEIAQRETGDAQAWKDFSGISDEVRNDPRKLQPGTTIRIPSAEDESLVDEGGNVDASKMVNSSSNVNINGVDEPSQEETNERIERDVNRVNPEAELARLEEQRQDRIDTSDRRLEESRDRRQELIQEREDAYENIDSMADAYEEGLNAYGVSSDIREQRATIEDLRRLRERSTDLMQQKDAAIANLDQQAVSTAFITGQKNRIEKAYNRRISQTNSILKEREAYLKTLQGQVTQAKGLVNDIVEAKTFDTKIELQKTQDFLDLNKEELDMLGTEYKDAVEDSKEYWEDKLEKEQSEIETVMNMMIEYPQAGINSDDTLQSAVEKAQEWSIVQPSDDVKSLMMKYPQAGIEEGDDFYQAMNKVSKLPEMNKTPEPEIFGSSAAGYYQQYWDNESKEWKKEQIIPPVSDSSEGGFVVQFGDNEKADLMTEDGVKSAVEKGATYNSLYPLFDTNSKLSQKGIDLWLKHNNVPKGEERRGYSNTQLKQTIAESIKQGFSYEQLSSYETDSMTEKDLTEFRKSLEQLDSERVNEVMQMVQEDPDNYEVVIEDGGAKIKEKKVFADETILTIK